MLCFPYYSGLSLLLPLSGLLLPLLLLFPAHFYGLAKAALVAAIVGYIFDKVWGSSLRPLVDATCVKFYTFTLC